MRHRNSFAEIHLTNLAYNFKLIQKLSSQRQFICPMVKANAYGHGAVEVSKTLIGLGVQALGVAMIEEAVQLREQNIQCEILVYGLFHEASASALQEYRITPVLSHFGELEILKKYSKKDTKQKIHLKFNTGMNRLGFECSEAERIKSFLEAHPNIQLSGICTHFLNGEDLRNVDGYSRLQLEKIKQVSKLFEAYPHHLHALNSSALMSSPAEFPNLGARPGISLYGGVAPTPELDFRPVMTVKSELALFHQVKAGENVSYGAHFQTKRDSLIGVVPFGYADGYFRQLSHQSEVLCHGQLVPIVGTVCMDYLMIDLTDLKAHQKFNLGDEVVLFGSQRNRQILASDLAKKVGTISYEVFTRISERVPRVFIR